MLKLRLKVRGKLKFGVQQANEIMSPVIRAAGANVGIDTEDFADPVIIEIGRYRQ